MNDKLQRLLSATTSIKISIDLISSPEQLDKINQLASENDGMITLKNVNNYFSKFILLNDDIQSNNWKGVFNIKKIRDKSNILTELLIKKIYVTDLKLMEFQLLEACSNLNDSIMLQGDQHHDVDNFDWLIGQTINSINETSSSMTQIRTQNSIINIEIMIYPCDECDEGYAELINLQNIVYPDHEIIDVSETKIKREGNYSSYEITVKYDDNKSKSFIYDCYFHQSECTNEDVYSFINIKF